MGLVLQLRIPVDEIPYPPPPPSQARQEGKMGREGFIFHRPSMLAGKILHLAFLPSIFLLRPDKKGDESKIPHRATRACFLFRGPVSSFLRVQAAIQAPELYIRVDLTPNRLHLAVAELSDGTMKLWLSLVEGDLKPSQSEPGLNEYLERLDFRGGEPFGD